MHFGALMSVPSDVENPTYTTLPSLKVTNMISIPEMSKKMCHDCGTADPTQLGHKAGQSTVILVYKGHIQEQ